MCVSGGRHHVWKQAYVNDTSLLAVRHAGQGDNEGVVPLLFNLGLSRGWVVNPTPSKQFRYSLYRRQCGPQSRSGLLRRTDTLPSTGVRTPNRPARGESQYRLSYPAPLHQIFFSRILQVMGIRKLGCADGHLTEQAYDRVMLRRLVNMLSSVYLVT